MKNNLPLCEPQMMRENYIKKLNESSNPTQKAKEIAEDLFALDLTVYSSNYTFDSLVYSAMSRSQLDNNISLHPEQIRIIDEIHNNAALIVSAPTSFGKTFCVFEYISRYRPNNIVLIVPTLALVDEYLKKIIKKYKDFFWPI
ncbi:DEAD/DEAH box helicase [Acetivibrio sp. MSJd-27]|uniref:DEAD/DEAH box helicase n=1 Tax=Acetivibrio sp. MSJd-27 TaxID=2841523 RepID=UPI001C11F00D|nr:DEAD/DEAH box helicase [Acetivibrio sp. MSJd-27]MBU5451438.1 DEAD/DEAH box helicase family protein [Acetivibrio sp. MSJd-27]